MDLCNKINTFTDTSNWLFVPFHHSLWLLGRAASSRSAYASLLSQGFTANELGDGELQWGMCVHHYLLIILFPSAGFCCFSGLNGNNRMTEYKWRGREVGCPSQKRLTQGEPTGAVSWQSFHTVHTARHCSLMSCKTLANAFKGSLKGTRHPKLWFRTFITHYDLSGGSGDIT